MAGQLVFGPDGLVLFGRNAAAHQEEKGAAGRSFAFAVMGQDAPIGQALFGLVQESHKQLPRPDGQRCAEFAL
jgi:hypothetical protein